MPIDHEYWVDAALTTFATLFRGATAYPRGIGKWRDDENAAVFGAYLLATRQSEAKRRRLQQRLAEALLYTKHTDDAEIQLARSELMSARTL